MWVAAKAFGVGNRIIALSNDMVLGAPGLCPEPLLNPIDDRHKECRHSLAHAFLPILD